MATDPPRPSPPLVQPTVDDVYGDRTGYDKAFLGTGKRLVPLPRLSLSLRASAAVNRLARTPDRTILPYHHFSVVMNAERRVAFFTAVNIDGRRTQKIRRTRDAWFPDPRIGLDEQTGVDLYARNELDRGHLVRRLDPVWGDTLDAARLADIDTFHLTNCSPQHAGFNRNKTLWAGLEDYVLKNTDVHDLRVSVFTGPIFDPADPIYRGVRLPRSFWKVVAMVRSTGEMSATGYLLSQAGLLPDLRAFDFGRYGTFQVRVAHIAELSRLRFGRLPRHDPLARVTSGVRGLSAVRLLEEPGQILL